MLTLFVSTLLLTSVGMLVGVQLSQQRLFAPNPARRNQE